MPELRADGLGVDEFVWMMPEEQAHLYTPSGIEGVAHTWQEDPKAMLRAGGATRLAELAAGTPFRYPKKENSVANQELARRVLQHVDSAEVGRERPQPTPAAAHHPPQAAAHHPGRLWRSAGRLCALWGRASARQTGVTVSWRGAWLTARPWMRRCLAGWPSSARSWCARGRSSRRSCSESSGRRARARSARPSGRHVPPPYLPHISPTSPAPQRKTIWQATGVHRGETEAELGRKRRQQELDNCRADMATLRSASVAALSQRSVLEQYGPALNMLSGGALGGLYGAARGWFRGWWQEVTPSVCRELMAHVGRRTGVGTALLVGTFEAAPWIKRQARASLGREDRT